MLDNLLVFTSFPKKITYIAVLLNNLFIVGIAMNSAKFN